MDSTDEKKTPMTIDEIIDAQIKAFEAKKEEMLHVNIPAFFSQDPSIY